jgi:4-amino-4-deoxy-L-arabinose transferase-like glycosyltransferase
VIWIAVAVGMALRLAWVLGSEDLVLWDAVSYRTLALSLAEGRGYGVSGLPSAFFVPGWPAWMSLFYRAHGGDTGVAIGSVLLGGATLGATYALGRDLLGARAAGIAAAIVALQPSLVLLPRLLLSEILALPLTVVSVWLIARAGRTPSVRAWALAGVACALATLVREASVALALSAGLIALGQARSRGPSGVVAFAVVFAVVLAPWVVRNRVALGTATLTTGSSVNLCIGLGDGATGGYRRLPWFEDTLEVAADAEADADARRCARDGLAHHPLSIVTLAPAKLSRLLAFDDWEVDEFYARSVSPGAARALAAVSDVGYWSVLALAALSMLRRGGPRVLVLTLASFAALTLATFGLARSHTVLLPLLAVLASQAVRRP